ncbi:MAG: DDE-type integrase/transposase/recombinase [Candidatus Pseudomonas phytovorans]|uniref:DDE-type integrase/transposase/recombinase n=1 Tax=Candidatus Pseudomonas phytovorans TaxID=3121377 RepID=A0AAJ6BDR6_9PSED|nr:Mu transposase C-terminal domain-containing protein [Pseudomonas sp.]WEK31026.1 MAG: DDE-type integrase/transposase/recombinase [Pseudomonas sp.]
MQTFSLKVKLVVIVRGVLMVLEKRLIDRRLLFFDELGEPTKLSEKEFYQGYERREIEVTADQPYLGRVPYVRNIPPDISCFPKKHGDEALRRRKYLNALTGRGQHKLPSEEDMFEELRKIAKKIGDACAPSISTIRRWASKYISDNVIKLIPQHALKGRAPSIQGELEAILGDVIAEHYLKPTLPTASKVIAEFQDRVKQKNLSRLPSDQLKMPCGMTVRRYLARLDPYLVDEARLGKHAAKQKHRTAIGMLRVHEILERWEIDHTQLDVQLVDETTGLCIGRPYLTIVMDRFSRMVMGYLLHLSAPNTETVLRVIERAIRPKAELLTRFPKVRNEWWARGLPTRIVPDNAAEFHAGDLIMGFNELGIEIMYPASRAPQKKGAVERFFSTQNLGLIHNLPGTTFSNIQQRGDYDSEKNACFTLPQLEAVLVKWIVDGYHQTPHRGLAMLTPAQVWATSEANHVISLPVDLDSLECILAKRSSVKVHHYGVEIGKLFYHSTELAELRMRLAEGEKVNVRYRDEAGHVWVHDRFRNLFFQVPAKDERMVGKSRELWRVAEKALREKYGEQPSFEATHQCYQEIMEDVEEARLSQKLRQRREAARAKIDKEGRKSEIGPPPKVLGEMEWGDDSIDHIPPAAAFKVSVRSPAGSNKP